MTEIVNLRLARKRKARADKEREAEANRIAFGRTKGERETARKEGERIKRTLDGHKRDDD